MPRYDYRCKAGHKYEKQEPFGSPVEHPCEKCGKTALRQLSTPTVIFKGGGFYETDYRSEGYKKAAEADKKAKDNGKSDAKKKSDGGSGGSCGCGKKPADQCGGSTSAKKD